VAPNLCIRSFCRGGVEAERGAEDEEGREGEETVSVGTVDVSDIEVDAVASSASANDFLGCSDDDVADFAGNDVDGDDKERDPEE